VATNIYDLLAVASLTFHELDCQHTEDARSVMLDRLLGTLILSISRTGQCLCLTLGTSSNISTSRPTSKPSAFEVFLLQPTARPTRYINLQFVYLLSDQPPTHMHSDETTLRNVSCVHVTYSPAVPESFCRPTSAVICHAYKEHAHTTPAQYHMNIHEAHSTDV